MPTSPSLPTLIKGFAEPLTSDDFNRLVLDMEAKLGRRITNVELGEALGRGDTHISRYRTGNHSTDPGAPLPYGVGVVARLLHQLAKQHASAVPH